jgi:hypothetical protein
MGAIPTHGTPRQLPGAIPQSALTAITHSGTRSGLAFACGCAGSRGVQLPPPVRNVDGDPLCCQEWKRDQEWQIGWLRPPQGHAGNAGAVGQPTQGFGRPGKSEASLLFGEEDCLSAIAQMPLEQHRRDVAAESLPRAFRALSIVSPP